MGLLQAIVNRQGGSPSGRIAVYDAPTSPPRLFKVAASSWPDVIERLATTTYEECQKKGASFPYVVLKEVVENLIHANFQEIVISIINNAHTIRISDQGPGISDKELVFEPGYTTASSQMKRYIRGVGSGLPVAKEIMTFSGGKIEINDNLGPGTVVTLSLVEDTVDRSARPAYSPSKRQTTILSLITELGSAGPSEVSKELGLSLSTVHRELICLEDYGLLKSDGQGKRAASTEGLNYLNRAVSAGSVQ